MTIPKAPAIALDDCMPAIAVDSIRLLQEACRAGLDGSGGSGTHTQAYEQWWQASVYCRSKKANKVKEE